jgi:hypothetical protein
MVGGLLRSAPGDLGERVEFEEVPRDRETEDDAGGQGRSQLSVAVVCRAR